MFENIFNSPCLVQCNVGATKLHNPGGPIYMYVNETALDMVAKKLQWI